MSDGDYRIDHRAPGREAAPLHDLTGGSVYPDDVYSSLGPRYYGTGDGTDLVTWAIVRKMRGHPNRPVRIYRATIKLPANRDAQIRQMEADRASLLRRGKLPASRASVYGAHSKSAVYDSIVASLAQLRAMPPPEKVRRTTINPGDWVTLDRAYAVAHGEGPMRGHYSIVSKVVPARTLYTNGDSILEWGYAP